MYDQLKTGSSESQTEAEELNQSKKRGNMHCDWFILLLLLPTPTIWFSLDRKGRSQKKMETFNSDSSKSYFVAFMNTIFTMSQALLRFRLRFQLLVILNLIVTASCPLTYLFNVWMIISKSIILCVFLKALLIVFIALETSFGHTLQHIYFYTVNHFI